ncbi:MULTISPECIES: hypothetical protein [Streptosporangium]|uniref:Uncharacterized protein n=1 Tax=Streptosporangium brasiliense TaxID=47480 RepID=A0ABT9RBJ8_9ACTN|nr:hypothetical protein [Streptosporangium brasiliense]MDP9866149.1 hypothetical protein [Streptosporangium brasiliense]
MTIPSGPSDSGGSQRSSLISLRVAVILATGLVAGIGAATLLVLGEVPLPLAALSGCGAAGGVTMALHKLVE